MARSATYTDPAFQPIIMVSLFGAVLIVLGLVFVLIQLWVSVRDREQTKVPVGDPWNGRTLEWSIPSPPPEYNFALIPQVNDRDDFTMSKENGTAYPVAKKYEDIEMPANTALGMILCFAFTILSFALVWHIWWLALVSFLAVPTALIYYSFLLDTTKIIPAKQVEREHKAWLAEVANATPVTREDETKSVNTGLAALELSETAS
ncbi:MAG: hypothetical protein H0A75_07285 [Candidatus Methanofishera endochildressiae]|uniref:Cytochrome oxidase subunit I profile domain-containing protein n=1 Tax=Candidatus Methanofishera endochildressiae TaxID=2738884 RepID=A0A7Z0MPY7_9GAMM|nr:hypothetical protein [Candidatus Methanofishera endochildressiae]